MLEEWIDQLRKLKPHILVATEMQEGFRVELRLFPGPVVKGARWKGFPSEDVDAIGD